LDYELHESDATHILDITIRGVVLLRRGWSFKGEDYVQICSHSSYWGQQLSPRKVRFHLPEMISKLPLPGKYWWNELSVGDWYQCHKKLQVMRKE